MILTRNGVEITFPRIAWQDELGSIWHHPTLAFMESLGWSIKPELPAPEPTQEQLLAQAKESLTQTIQNYLDNTAKTRGYDGILSLCTYVTSTDPTFALEGQAGVEFRDACWRKGYEVMEAVLQGQLAIPTEEELLALLPEIGW